MGGGHFRGTRRAQLDSLSYNQVLDDEFRAATGNAAVDPRLILEGSVAADAAIVRAVKAGHPGLGLGLVPARDQPGQQDLRGPPQPGRQVDAGLGQRRVGGVELGQGGRRVGDLPE